MGLTRRKLLRDAAGIGAALAVGERSLALAEARLRRRQRVAVLGGGVAGLTAAHELALRGFDVTVYERHRSPGGKARTIYVPGSGAGGRHDLPGEHGFRYFPGFYQGLPDTMRRIPFGAGGRSTYDNLVTAGQVSYARAGGYEDILVPVAPTPRPWTPESMARGIAAALQEVRRVPPDEIAYFVRQLAVFISSCDARRLGEFEHRSWWDYIGAERFSEEYRRYFATALTRNLAAADPRKANTRTIGLMAEQVVFNQARRQQGDGDADRVLNGPTSAAWLDAWVAELKRLGVRFRLGVNVRALEQSRGRVTGARAIDGRGRAMRADADYFVCAMPVPKARPLLAGLRGTNGAVHRLPRLETDWMTGMQFFLDRQLPIVNGHISYVDSPWALTSISQQQFWPGHRLAARYGDGRVRDCLSVIVSNWHVPGLIYGRPARSLRPPQIAREVLAQIRAHLNDTGRDVLPKGAVVSWFLDPAIGYTRAGRAHNDDQLLINTVGSWANRPGSTTGVGNLFLAADYVRTNINIASMEGANEAGRLAANAVLDAAGSRAEPAAVFPLWQPPEFQAIRAVDRVRYANGQPNALDTPWPG